MVDGLTRIRDIVSDLRAFSRPAEESVQPLDLSKVCDAAIRILSPSVRHRAVVRTVYALDTPWIVANESRIGQVVVNLILNASQAMPARPAAENVILVRTARGEDGGAIIEVEDNGTGIPPGVLPKLFDPFFTTKPVGDGTGLGLSVCQSIVTALHGTIDVDTAVGRGTTFRVRIPPAPAERVNAPRSLPPAMAARPPPGVARVLVVDDEPSVRRAISHVLRARGFAVAESKGGRDAVAQILETDFTAIVCDLMMPEMSGDEVWNEVFRQRPDQARRMIFISGGTVTQQTRAFASREDIVLLDKPLDFRLLVDAINAINAVGRDAASG
jgi:CheY-like chemotaxis protein